jgi:signal transduction histidine kinase
MASEEAAAALGYAALAITDECSLAGVVRAHVEAKEHGLHLIIGSEINLLTAGGDYYAKLVLLATDRAAYGNLSEFITLARTRFRLPETHIFLRDRTTAPAIVLGDEDELKAAVWNLIDNAIKYSTPEPHITMTLEETADHTRYALKIADRGSGIAPNELKRVFRRFYRIHGPSVRAKGSGLGLFIVRSVAKRHGGKAYAESEGHGRGSTFTMLLPKGPDAA